MTTAVDHLKKIRLEIQHDERTEPFEFIFGIASDGMCPFEYELLHKAPGEHLHLRIPRAEAAHTFAHLFTPLRKALALFDLPAILDLQLTIAAVMDAAPREVVKAMAQSTEEDSCGGDCGCGCGGH